MGALKVRDIAEVLNVSERHARRVASPTDSPVWTGTRNVVQTEPGKVALSLTLPAGPNGSEADIAEAQRRLRAIEPLLRPERYRVLWAEHKGSKTSLIDWIATEHDTARRTIYNWLALFEAKGLQGLVPKDRADKGKPQVLNDAALNFLLACTIAGSYSVRDIYRAYNEERAWRAAHLGQPMGALERNKYKKYLDDELRLRPEALLPECSYATMTRWFDRIPEVVRTMARDGDEAFHNSQEILSWRDIAAVDPLEYVVMDHRRLDIFCLIADRESGKPKWKLARPWLTAAIDMRTRKWLGWVIVESPSSDSIATVLKQVFMDHGVPVACYWDNGKDFRCEWLEGGRKARQSTVTVDGLNPQFRGVLDSLGIRVHHAIVKRARAKLIEPNFGRTADFDRTLAWWCGNTPSARPTERFDKLLGQHEKWLEGTRAEAAFPTLEEVAILYDGCMRELNERELEGDGMAKIKHTGGRGWMSPNEAWQKLIPRIEKRTIGLELLHLCFMKRKELTVRNGEVQTTWGGTPRHYRMLGNSIGLTALNGRTVEFAYDPLDLQTAVIYYESRLFCLVECIELRKMGERDFVRDERDRRAQRRNTNTFIEAVHAAEYVPDAFERARRRDIQPRPEPQRQIVSAKVPAALIEAAEAVRDNQPGPLPEPDIFLTTVRPGPEQTATDDDVFTFFS